MKIILSIKPEYVEKIFSGEKLYEYRKCIFKKSIKNVLIYSTMPEGKIVGEFSIDAIEEAPPKELWEDTKHLSGITKDFFDSYFENRSKAYALKIKDVTKYKNPIDPYKSNFKFVAPQSFRYIEDDLIELLLNNK